MYMKGRLRGLDEYIHEKEIEQRNKGYDTYHVQNEETEALACMASACAVARDAATYITGRLRGLDSNIHTRKRSSKEIKDMIHTMFKLSKRFFVRVRWHRQQQQHRNRQFWDSVTY